ncbi:hypothetical protein M0657_002506 [Pyricularia oryzae]|nr:hypothetical protein M9X92_001735 [Pyricularia oryzae]KAI7928682.1 hypothetical protein M0657_002506 [Pyricularia oryzae]
MLSWQYAASGSWFKTWFRFVASALCAFPPGEGFRGAARAGISYRLRRYLTSNMVTIRVGLPYLPARYCSVRARVDESFRVMSYEMCEEWSIMILKKLPSSCSLMHQRP